MPKPRPLRLGLPLLLILTAGCDGLLGPDLETVATDDDIIVARVDDDAPELIDTDVSFWAVRGETRAVEIRYEAPAGYDGKCLRFVVPGDALLRRADGSVIAPGDSVRISIRVIDARLFLFEFDPGGLRFDPSHPARVEVRYRWLAADVNGDGQVDRTDERFADEMAIWKQEEPGDDWNRVPSTTLLDEQEVHAEITGFTRYALASDRQGVRPLDRLRDAP